MSKIWGPVQTSQEVSDDLENHTRFVWDGSHLLQEVHPDGRYTYLYADQDSYEPLAQVRDWTTADGENCQQTRYFHCDQIGIPREMTDKDGNLLWFGNYTGWGRLKEEIKVTDSAYQPFRLQNQYADPETGLHYNFFRYYESDAGRFVNQDPIGLWGGSNFYWFARNSQEWIDPLGLSAISMDAAIDLALKFLKEDVPAQIIDGPTGIQVIQNYEENGKKMTKRVGFDVNPGSCHVQKLGPHLNLQTQVNGKIIKKGKLAVPHLPIDPSTIKKGDY